MSWKRVAVDYAVAAVDAAAEPAAPDDAAA